MEPRPLDCSDFRAAGALVMLRFASEELAMEFIDVFEYAAVFGHELQRSRLESGR